MPTTALKIYSMARGRLLLWLLTALLITCFTLTGWGFSQRIHPTPPEQITARTAVAFTGQYPRVTHALRLLETGKIQRLLVSGVNSGAGMNQQHFAEKFALSDKLQNALAENTLELGTWAQTTLQNAQEAQCWLHEKPQEIAILLITSADHMPRASIALEAALPNHEIQRAIAPGSDERMTASILMTEFTKYLATYILAHVPSREGPPKC